MSPTAVNVTDELAKGILESTKIKTQKITAEIKKPKSTCDKIGWAQAGHGLNTREK